MKVFLDQRQPIPGAPNPIPKSSSPGHIQGEVTSSSVLCVQAASVPRPPEN